MACSRTSAALAIFLVSTLRLGCLEAQEQVLLTVGKLQGTTLTSRYGRRFPAFIGIPYAQPPVGSLRYGLHYLQ